MSINRLGLRSLLGSAWLAALALALLAGCSRSEAPQADAPSNAATGRMSRDHTEQCKRVRAATLQATVGLMGLAAPQSDAAAMKRNLAEAASLAEKLPEDGGVREAWREIVAMLPGIQGRGPAEAHRLATSPHYQAKVAAMNAWYAKQCL